MRSIINKSLIAAAVFSLPACSDFTELNVNPNQLGADKINSKYILTSALSFSANNYIREYTYGYTSEHGISEAMQYMQRDYIGYEINSFVWRPVGFTTMRSVTDSQTLLQNSASEPDEELKKFYSGVASVIRAFWFGFYTSAWGDIPYSQAVQGQDLQFKPVYDTQKEVFKGIIQELKTANDLLEGLGTVSAIGSADILYGGNAVKWRKLANSLRIRYYLRLSEKKDELKGENFDIVAELKEILANPVKYPVFEGNADNAAVKLPGTDAFNSWIGGPLANSNRSQFYRRKPCSTIIDFLKNTSDPRLTAWFRPVDVQLKVGSSSEGYVRNNSGQILRYIPQYQNGLDTSRYVGLKPALGDPTIYNLGATASYSKIGALNNTLYLDQGANPHVSYLADMYAQNTAPLVKAVLMSYAELSFLLAEASLKGWIGENAAQYYRKGIEGSLDQYEIASGNKSVYNTKNHDLVAFDRAAFLSGMDNEFTNNPDRQHELLMSQKWVALWMTPEFWFDWRRTGLPSFSENVVEGSNGNKIPVRLIYGSREYIVNESNVRAAVNKLQPAEDTQWSGMWLLQGTSQPW